VVVNTGHWGTGAFGGNRVLMVALQIIEARLAGVDRLVYHTVDSAGSEAYQQGKRLVDERLLPAGAAPRVDAMVAALHAAGFAWGVSDGN
jgi:Poly (ADP-ribose) glycohydrolase (PARG)